LFYHLSSAALKSRFARSKKDHINPARKIDSTKKVKYKINTQCHLWIPKRVFKRQYIQIKGHSISKLLENSVLAEE